jgi:hypothetical protein
MNFLTKLSKLLAGEAALSSAAVETRQNFELTAEDVYGHFNIPGLRDSNDLLWFKSRWNLKDDPLLRSVLVEDVLRKDTFFENRQALVTYCFKSDLHNSGLFEAMIDLGEREVAIEAFISDPSSQVRNFNILGESQLDVFFHDLKASPNRNLFYQTLSPNNQSKSNQKANIFKHSNEFLPLPLQLEIVTRSILDNEIPLELYSNILAIFETEELISVMIKAIKRHRYSTISNISRSELYGVLTIIWEAHAFNDANRDLLDYFVPGLKKQIEAEKKSRASNFLRLKSNTADKAELYFDSICRAMRHILKMLLTDSFTLEQLRITRNELVSPMVTNLIITMALNFDRINLIDELLPLIPSDQFNSVLDMVLATANNENVLACRLHLISIVLKMVFTHLRPEFQAGIINSKSFFDFLILNYMVSNINISNEKIVVIFEADPELISFGSPQEIHHEINIAQKDHIFNYLMSHLRFKSAEVLSRFLDDIYNYHDKEKLGIYALLPNNVSLDNLLLIGTNQSLIEKFARLNLNNRLKIEAKSSLTYSTDLS